MNGRIFSINGVSEKGEFNISFRTTIACNKLQALLRLERAVGKIIRINSIVVNPVSLMGKELVEL